MKKTALLAVAFATCLGYAPAQAADVVSSNIVGYNKISLQAGYNLLGNNWNLVGGQDGLVTEVLDATALPGFDGEAFNSQLQLWTGEGYTIYGWAGNVGDATYDYQWLNTTTLEPTAIEAPKGTAFWVKAGAATDVVFSGEVASEDTLTISVTSGYSLLANPFPETISIQNIQSANLPGFDGEAFNAQLQLWTGEGYTIYGWAGNVGDAAYDNKWLDTTTLNPATVNLDIGKGFWIKSTTAADIVFTK